MSSSSSSSSGVMVAQSLPPELSHVIKLVDSKPEALARGDMGMHAAALAAAQLIYKISLEAEKSAATPISRLLAGLSPEASAPTTRSQKRKRDELPKGPPLAFRPTPKIGRHVDGLGMNASKLWTMMEHRTGPLCGILEAVVAPEDIIEEEDEEEEGDEEEESEEDEEAEFVLGDEDEDEDISGLSDDEDEDEDDDEDEDEYESDDGDSYLGDTTMELSRTEDHADSDSDDAEEASDDDEINHAYLHNLDLDRAQNPQKASKRRAHPTLDDTFFSIDDFNRETEALEAQNRSSGALDEDDDDDEGEEDVDLFMGVHDVDDTPEEANDPKYQDFFAPPPKSKSKTSPEKPRRRVKLLVASPPGPKRSVKVRFNEEVKVRNIKSKRTKASLLAELMEAEGVEEGGEGEGPWTSEMLDEEDEDEDEEMGSEDEDEEMESDEGSDIGPSKDDLFADDNEEDESEAGLSNHQKRLAALTAEIQALEAENVAPKPWTMQGEATARSRPQNALLEADLEFEHVGKVVPVVTEESVKSLEERIKARIIEGRYDDVVRKRNVEAKPFLPSRMFELKDTQSEKSLAQIYEDEYTAAASGSKVADDRDGKLAENHKEITELWDGICYKLDALSNAHFTPKPPQAKIETVTNMASASLESALPTSLSTSTLLAPEEVYTPSSAEIRARSELTPSEKKAARGRDRKKRRKERDILSSAADNSSQGGRQPKNVKEAKEQALNGLVKNGKGVTVIGKPSKNDPKPTATKGDKEERDGKRFKL